MCRTSTATTGVATFFKATEMLESFDGMKKVWSAGKFWERNSGCHNACAIIYKLPVLPHWDGKDYGVSVLFAAGRFERGYLYLPQFQLIFEYGPGALAAFYASWIIHAVGDWDNIQMEPNDKTTLGWIGMVFYIPYSSMEVLGDKEADWGLMMNYGRFPAVRYQSRTNTSTQMCRPSRSQPVSSSCVPVEWGCYWRSAFAAEREALSVENEPLTHYSSNKNQVRKQETVRVRTELSLYYSEQSDLEDSESDLDSAPATEWGPPEPLLLSASALDDEVRWGVLADNLPVKVSCRMGLPEV
ncbi:hypothetical protein FB451DRAFT_1436490 [Mycena latifolia]|nr:hypothetical protein FB451DRAFT_1436490 [Mycena latifolia]